MNTTFWIQLLGVIFGLGMTYFTFVRYKRKELSKSEFLVWQGCWAVLIFVALIPSILDPIIAPLNFYRRLDFFVVVGFFVLLSLCFYNYNSMKRIEKKMDEGFDGVNGKIEGLHRRMDAELEQKRVVEDRVSKIEVVVSPVLAK